MYFLSVLCSIVRLQGTHLAHHPSSRIFQGVREMGRPFYAGLSITLNRRGKEAGQGMAPTGHTLICFSLAQGCRSGRRLCGKIEFGEKPHLNMLFSWLLINIYCRKNMGHYFLGNPPICPDSPTTIRGSKDTKICTMALAFTYIIW
jgi:hypothetical protein